MSVLLMWVLHSSSASGSASGFNWLDLRVVWPGLHHLAGPLMLDRTLQGMVGTDAILHLHSSSFWGCMELCPRIPNLGG